MVNRCRDEKNRYFSLGIKVCDQWVSSFDTFLKDVGHRPSLSHSIDRYPNRDGNYEPGNVRWATKKQQSENRGTTLFLELDGETLSASEWSVAKA